MNQEKNDIILTCIKPICLNSYRNTKLPDRTRTATFITLAQISFSWAFSKASAGYSFDFVQCKQMPTQAEYFLFLTAFARQTKHQELLKREKKHELQSYFCVLCTPDVEESVQHLFWLCSFSQQCWGIFRSTQTLSPFKSPSPKCCYCGPFFMVGNLLLPLRLEYNDI